MQPAIKFVKTVSRSIVLPSLSAAILLSSVGLPDFFSPHGNIIGSVASSSAIVVKIY